MGNSAIIKVFAATCIASNFARQMPLAIHEASLADLLCHTVGQTGSEFVTKEKEKSELVAADEGTIAFAMMTSSRKATEGMKMKLLIGLIEAACFSILCLAQQSNQPAKPGPEIKKLDVYVGQRRYEGESKPGPSGPAEKFSGNATGKMILNGFFFEWRWKDKGTAGTQEGFEIQGYDPINKNFASRWFVDDGSTCTGSYVVEANKFTYLGKCIAGGRQYLSKVTEIFAPDLMSFVQKEETSIDGKTWSPSYEAKYTKLRPVPGRQE